MRKSSFYSQPVLELANKEFRFSSSTDSFNLAISGKGVDMPLKIVYEDNLNPVDICISKGMKGSCLVVSCNCFLILTKL
jgi:hypothetical protein